MQPTNPHNGYLFESSGVFEDSLVESWKVRINGGPNEMLVIEKLLAILQFVVAIDHFE